MDRKDQDPEDPVDEHGVPDTQHAHVQYYKEEGQRLICSCIRTGPEATAKSGGFVLTELCGFIPVNERSR